MTNFFPTMIGTARCLLVAMLLAVAFAGPAGGQATEGLGPPQGFWQKLPPPPARGDYFSDIAIEPGGVLWIMGGNTVAYWDGQRFIEPKGLDLRSGQYLTKFLGGPDCGLYLTQPGERDPGNEELHRGKIYRLCDGQAQLVAEFIYGKAHYGAPVYLSRSGRLLNWTRDFVAFWTGSAWEKVEARFEESPAPLVFDTGQGVYLYQPPRLCGFDAQGRAVAHQVPLQPPKSSDVKGAPWGRDRGLIIQYGRRGVQAIELSTGQGVDASGLNRDLAGADLYELFADRDGSVWIMASKPDWKCYKFCRVSPAGEVATIEETAGFAWDNHQFVHSPKSVLCARDGSHWFALHRQGILCLKEGRRSLHDGRTGLALGNGCTMMADDTRGRIYAASSHSLYVFHSGTPDAAASQTLPPRPKELPVAWKHPAPQYRRIARAWNLGGAIALATSDPDPILLLDPASGKELGTLGTKPPHRRETWLTPGRTPGQVLLCLPGQILTLELPSGNMLHTTAYNHDLRIAPVAVENDLLVVRGGRGEELVRIDRSGKELWQCRLPGYVQTHLAVCGAFAVVQTRGSSYGGQATTGVNLNTGERLWSETVNAYGCGAVFGDDAAYVVEADEWLSPKATEGWLICRDPRTGKRRWEFRRPGTISHQPLVDLKTDRVYAVFDQGEVVCLRSSDGAVVWKAPLPESPLGAPAASYDPYWPAIGQYKELIMVVDRNHVLHFFHAGEGRRIQSIALLPAFGEGGKLPLYVNLLAMPWIEGESLVVATSSGVAAYQIQ